MSLRHQHLNSQKPLNQKVLQFVPTSFRNKCLQLNYIIFLNCHLYFLIDISKVNAYLSIFSLNIKIPKGFRKKRNPIFGNKSYDPMILNENKINISYRYSIPLSISLCAVYKHI